MHSSIPTQPASFECMSNVVYMYAPLHYSNKLLMQLSWHIPHIPLHGENLMTEVQALVHCTQEDLLLCVLSSREYHKPGGII